MKRLRVAVLFGGRSAEHEVSLRSAASVVEALDRRRYEIVPVRIEKDGRWTIPARSEYRFVADCGGETPRRVQLGPDPTSAGLVAFDEREGCWRPLGEAGRLDVVFPVLHGTFGEDGTIQGLLDLAGLPYVGAGTGSSAVAMDKVFMKSLFSAQGLPVAAWTVALRTDWERDRDGELARLGAAFPLPVFVKPANLGSSVGVSKVSDPAALGPALDLAFRYDRKALVEEGIDAREIELSVLGNDEPQASVPGEIVPSREFYSYEAKYIDDASELLIPAPLDEAATRRAQELALAAFRAVDAAGMARVDLFCERGTGRLLVNEVNTIPGFTSISMYPKLWEASGLAMPRLVDRLVELALERARDRQRNATSYPSPTAPPA